MALPENVVGTVEQSITFRGVVPTETNQQLVAARSATLRALSEDLLTLTPLPGSEPEEASLRQLTLPAVGLTVDNMVRIAHVELTESDVADDQGVLLVNSLRVVFTQAVLA